METTAESKIYSLNQLRWRIAQWGELLWWKQYLKSKSPGTYLQWKTAYWSDFLKKTDSCPLPDSTILDAGCGPAGIFLVFPHHKVVAIDPLLDRYEQNLQHFSKAEFPYTEFVTINMELYQPGKVFDWVFCINAINHVADLRSSMLRLANLTRKGGTLVISTDMHRFSLPRFFFRMWPWDLLHPQQLRLKDFENEMASAGFEIVHKYQLKKGLIFDYWAFKAVRR